MRTLVVMSAIGFLAVLLGLAMMLLDDDEPEWR